ncbi:AsmA family protein [Roseovarius sp. TE539]|uniref:AsmA family protein n=1 Tax=Roseovarius sp. TE539 TaxID=2249812 RepID=UPI000DE03B24|nr:AsmA family protein [Roseovarius sp. TE539]RBI74499.1 AsmA family protein [Roseovarius sp. TE539]
MKWILRILGIVVLIVVIAGVSLVLLPGERIAKIAADQISGTTGRQVEMTGDTRISLYPVLGISTGTLSVANAGWSDAGPMIEAESLKVGVDPVALMSGDVRITGLEAVDPVIRLERAADGRVNWELGVEGVSTAGDEVSEATAAGENPLALTLDRALITGATVSYADHGAGTRTVMENMDLDLRWPDYEGEASFEAVLRPSGDAVRVSGRVLRVGTVIEGGLSGFNMAVTAPGGSLSFEGRGGAKPELEGDLDVDIGDTARFASALGAGAPDIPQGLGRSVTATGRVTLTDGPRLSMRDARIVLDGNTFSGAADVLPGGTRPKLNAQLSAGALDLSALGSGGGDGDAGGGDPVSAGWSTAPIDASALGLLDAEVSLNAESLDMGTFRFGATRILMTLNDARAVFDLRELSGYDGTVTGQFVINNRSGLSVGGDMTATGIAMEPFLTDAAGITRFSTTGDASLDFLGVGNSVDAIMNSLQGSASVSTGRGVISGFDLDRLMRSGDGTGGTTVFDRLGASFDLREGNAFNDDLLMVLPLARAEGEGRIGLGAQDLDYLFTPTLLEGETRRGLAIPVRIRGSWSDPRITPDLERALELNFEGEKKKLEEKAIREIEKEFGIEKQEGESAEDALKRELEDRALDELEKLFE